MSGNPQAKDPLDVLQNMVNEILIETGKALRASSKEGAKDFSSVNARLQKNVPRTIDTFHQALDDLEWDIVRAKAVFIRDLKEMQEKRIALENPPQTIVEAHPSLQNSEQSNWAMNSSPEVTKGALAIPSMSNDRDIKQDSGLDIPQPSAPAIPKPTNLPTEDIPMATQSLIFGNQGPSPPSSLQPIGLGITTEPPAAESAPATIQQPDPSLEDLFGAGDADVNFEGMEFMTQNTEQSHTQNDDFDMANFGNSQDFSMTDLNISAQASINNSSGTTKEINDMFTMANNQAADNMDLDFDLGGADTDFNDLFDAGNELNHDLDSSFFES